jgi:acetyltransferase-like isoleucine patch superfamily enzyme
MKIFFNTCLYSIGAGWSLLYSHSSKIKANTILNKIYTAWLSSEFSNISKSSIIAYQIDLVGGKYISIGDNCYIGKRTFLTAWDKYRDIKFQPKINIGNNVSIGEDCHISAINTIQIGNNVLFGKKVTVSDNSHGKSEFNLLQLPPSDRPMHSNGPVIIEDGVWIGDKVSILANVRIGKNSIIGANAVVTKDIPENSIATGIPAIVIKTIIE